MHLNSESYKNLSVKIRALERRVTHLSKQKARFLSAIENIQDAYYETDIEGNMTFFNRASRKSLGYSHDELMGMNYRSIVVEDDLDHVKAMFNKVYETGRSLKGIVYKYKTKDNRIRHSETYISLIRDENGKPIGFSGVTRDITHRVRALNALENARDRLEQTVAERTKTLSATNRILEKRTQNLEEANVALRVLLESRKSDKAELEEQVLFNVENLILPHLKTLKNTGLDQRQRARIDTIETKLQDIVSSFSSAIASGYYKLTPTEILIADLIRSGKTNRDIARIRNLSVRTIQFHRENIRNKLGLKHSKTNLRTFLMTLS